MTASNDVPPDGRPASPFPTVAAPARRTLRDRLPDEVGVIVALLAIVVFVGLLRPNFANPANLVTVVANATFFGIMALGMVYLLAVGELDLSVGSNFYAVCVVIAMLILAGVDPWLAALVGVVVGMALGVLNGVIAAWLRVPVIIITLGTLSVFRGLALVISGSRVIFLPDKSSSLFTVIDADIAGVPVPVIVFGVLVVVLQFVLHRTQFGYRVLALGSNREAARLVGMRVTRIQLVTLGLMGLMCGISGVLFVGYFGSVDTSVGTGFELLVISAAIIGGTSLSGGSGTVVGAAAGVLIIASISAGIVHFGVEAKWSVFVTGAVILVAIAVDRIVRRHQLPA